MKNFITLLNVAFFATTLLFTSCGKDDGVTQTIVNDLTINFDENPTNGQVVGTVSADGSGVFSITSQTPAGALNIDPSTGELTVADADLFDYETNPVITATISVEGAANTGTVTVNLNDLNEISVQDLVVAIDENPIDGQVVGSIQVDGGGTLSFSITNQTPAGALSIDASTGELTVVDPNLFDFETNPVITANIEVDNAVNTVTAMATINLIDVDEISVQDLTIDMDENPTDGQVIGMIQANSIGSLTFTITFQSTAGALNIDQNTGELSVADHALFDFETNPNMFAVILVENAVSSVSANATINLNDLHEIGEFNFGGVIFWVNAANDEGYVVSMNESTGATWGCSSTSIAGANGVDIGTGAANTLAIVSSCSTPGIAADIANDVSNGYNDWFLPSKNELNEVYVNKTVINATLSVNGGNALTNAYWTSTEFNLSNVWFQNFLNGSQHGTGKFGLSPKVRAIRAWTDF